MSEEPLKLQEIAEEIRRRGKTEDLVAANTVRNWIKWGLLKAKRVRGGWKDVDFDGFEPPTAGGRPGRPKGGAR